MGSRIALSALEHKLIFRGVDVSIVPRNALNPIKLTSDGRKAKLLINRYGLV